MFSLVWETIRARGQSAKQWRQDHRNPANAERVVEYHGKPIAGLFDPTYVPPPAHPTLRFAVLGYNKTKKVTKKKEEVARYDHVYDSTSAYGGTIFWKFGQDYLNATHAKEYK